MKTQKVKGLDIKVPNSKAFAYETPPHLPKLHTNTLVIGVRGIGKTVATVNLMQQLPFDRIFAISPSMKSNKEIMKNLKIEDEDVFDNPDDISCLDKIKEAIEAEAEDLMEYKRKLKRYNEMMKKINGNDSLFSVEAENLLEFFQNGMFQKPTHKWGGERPCCACLVDDCIGSGIFTSGIKKLNSMVIRHRHLGQLDEGGAIGISLFFLLQSYKAAAGGISKCIRNNATNLLVFRNKNEKQLLEIAEECGGEVDQDTFMRIYDYCIQDKHDFMFIDFFKKDNHPSMFRRSYNEFITNF